MISPRRTPSFKKVYDSMRTFRNNGYQWFQVAEVTYDNFMVRHTALSGCRTTTADGPGAAAPGPFSLSAAVYLMFGVMLRLDRRCRESAGFRSSPC